MSPGFHSDIPEAEYHADRASLSFSGAKLMLKAPAIYRHRLDHPEHKDAFDFGSAAHALVLGAGMESIYVTPLDKFTTNAAKAEKAEAHRVGLSIITPADWETVCAMADALSSHDLAMRLLSKGEPEVSAYAPDPHTGIMRRGRFDWLGETILTDYKTAVSSDPETFAASAARFSYEMQASWYLDLASDLGHPATAFAFIVQMKEPPYLVSVIELDQAALDLGRAKNRRALERFRDCRESGLWPGYLPATEFATVSLPKWAFYAEEASA